MASSLQITNFDKDIPLRDVVFETLRKAILTGELKPGERLMEIHLAQRMGVSRTPVREAIRMLELENLVTMVPRCGAKVASITTSGLKDVLEVREALEELAIKLACKRSTDDQVRRLKEAMERFENAIESGNLARIAQSDEKFHNIIVEASHNEKLAEMTANLSQQIYRYRYECIKDSSMYAELIEEHRKMYESIYYRKQNEAVEVVKQHITKQQESIMRNLHLEEE